MAIPGKGRIALDQHPQKFGHCSKLTEKNRNISISRGKSEGRPEGAKRPTAGDEPREFTSEGEGGRMPPFFEKLQIGRAIVDLM